MKKFLSMILVAMMILSFATAFASGYVYGATGNSNVRTGPSLNATDIGTLHKGETATFLGGVSTDYRGVDWYEVSWNGHSAWVSSRYTTLNGASSYTSSSSSSSSSYSSYSCYSVVRGVSGNSNLRQSPSLNAASLGLVLHKGETATFLGGISTDYRGVDWYQVSFCGRTGWVSSRYTALY